MEPPLSDLERQLQQSKITDLSQVVVNAPFSYRIEMVNLGIGIIVLLIVDKNTKQIHRIALSNTELAEGTTKISLIKFQEIKIPLDYKGNIISEAIRTGEPQMTEDWQYLFAPALSPEQARLNQAGGGISCSHVYPLSFNDDAGAIIFSYYKESLKIGRTEKSFMLAYAKLVSERLENDGVTARELIVS